MNCRQLCDYVVLPVLSALGLNSPSAVNLVLGTAAQETGMGHYIVQQGIGFDGGIGIYQCQQKAYDDTWDNMLPAMQMNILKLTGYASKPQATRMASDLLLSTAMCRLYYYAIKAALPSANDLNGLASYWKTFYNSPSGKGKTTEFIANYQKYIV